MNKKDVLFGFIIGIFSSLVGTCLFITFFTEFDILYGIKTIKNNGYLGKVITLGTTLDLVVFAILLKKDKESMAGGVIFAVIILTFLTLLI
jgi:hypothetical protein